MQGAASSMQGAAAEACVCMQHPGPPRMRAAACGACHERTRAVAPIHALAGSRSLRRLPCPLHPRPSSEAMMGGTGGTGAAMRTGEEEATGQAAAVAGGTEAHATKGTSRLAATKTSG